MLQDRFTQLLEDLSSELGIELKPDANHSCLIKIQEKVEIQMEMDPQENHLLVLGSILGELSSGKFREEILFLALKANAMPYPRMGDFAFSTKLNSLLLFEILNLDHFTSEHILTFLIPFIHKALAWKEALMQGMIPTHLLETDFKSLQNNNLFKL